MSRKPKRRRGRKARSPSIVARLLTGVTAALIVAATSFLAWLLMVYPERPGPGAGDELRMTLDSGDSFDSVVSRLVAEGVIADERWFRLLARVTGDDRQVREGIVVVHDDENPRMVLWRISAKSPAPHVRVMIPEGYNRFEIGDLFEWRGVCLSEAFVAATEDPALLLHYDVKGPSLEGVLFPDSYDIRVSNTAATVVDILVSNFQRRYRGLTEELPQAEQSLRDSLGFDRIDIVNLASIVEEEAAVAEERPVIAGVFLNRLRSETFRPRHRLYADPTIAYGCLAEPERAASCATFEGRVSSAMQQDRDNRYNTYRHAGLPPGPISNPGLASIRSVLAPEAHDYLFFVVSGNRRHHFSETFEEHQEAVRRYRQRQAEE